MSNLEPTTNINENYKYNRYAISSREISRSLPYLMKQLNRDYESLINALDNDDYETIWRVGHVLCGRGQSYGFKSLNPFGNLLKLEAERQNKNELKFLAKVFSNLIL